jgi:hypothetical protein
MRHVVAEARDAGVRIRPMRLGRRFSIARERLKAMLPAQNPSRFPLRPVAPSRPPAIALAFYSGIGNILAENDPLEAIFDCLTY